MNLIMELVLTVAFPVLLTLCLVLFYEWVRRANEWFLWIAFLLGPITLLPYWISIHQWGLFEWSKLSTIVVTACALLAVRSVKNPSHRGLDSGLKLLFALNIFEAVVVDFLLGNAAGWMNGSTGLLLLVGLSRQAFLVDRQGRKIDVLYPGISRAWIVGFTFWNLTFLYNNYPIIVGHHICVLGVPLLIGWKYPGRWFQARIFLLAMDLIVLATFDSALVPRFDTTSWYEPNFGWLCSLGTLSFCLIGIGWPLRVRGQSVNLRPQDPTVSDA